MDKHCELCGAPLIQVEESDMGVICLYACKTRKCYTRIPDDPPMFMQSQFCKRRPAVVREGK
jgi:hypothetical protein